MRGIVVAILVAFAFEATPGLGDELSLVGQHAFQLGDDPAWAEAEFDDSDWQQMTVPQDWDAAGIAFGEWIGWYRIHFSFEDWMANNAGVLLGPISDADEVWLNGKLIGRAGTIGTSYETSALMPRLVSLPAEQLRNGDNVLAIRVMRVYYSGGIMPSAKLQPCIGPLVELENRVLNVRQHTNIALTAIFTIWTGAVLLGLVLFRQSELRSAFRTLAALMALYLLMYGYSLPVVLQSSLHSPSTELFVSMLAAAAPWLFLRLTHQILRLPEPRWVTFLSVAIGTVYALAVLVLAPSDRLLITLAMVGVTLIPGVIGTVACARAIKGGIPGSRAYSVGFLALLIPTLSYGFPSLVVYIDHIPLDAYAAALFVLCCFVVLLVRYRILRTRVEMTSRALLTAQEDERRRLSRELHDGVNQSVFAVRLSLQMEHEKLQHGDEVPAAALAELIGETENIGDELRRVVRELRPSILEQMDITDAIHWHAHEMSERCALKIAVTFSKDVATSDTVKDHLYRVFQEALRNTMRHADASRVDVSIEGESGDVKLVYTDDGRGFSRDGLETQGFGLNTMEERAALLGGYCRIQSSPNRGVTIEVRVPTGMAGSGPN